MKNKRHYILIFSFLSVISLQAQQPKGKDKSQLQPKQNGYYQNTVQKGTEEFQLKQNPITENKVYTLNFSSYKIPNDVKGYNPLWHNAPLNQGITGTCWCFAGTSFIESEIFRQSGKKIKLSEMYIVYQEYLERARYFVQKRGDVYLGEGSESNAVVREMKLHGAMPAQIYTGLLPGQTVYDHKAMFQSIKTYLESVKRDQIWNEKLVIETVKGILNQFMGEPPANFVWEGKIYSPESFVKDYLQIKLNEYFSFMSTKGIPFNQKGLLDEPDNWWKSKDYYNVNLSDYFDLIVRSLDSGYSVAICGDVSEPGYNSRSKAGIIPDFDIPSEYINDESRYFRLQNETTSDDHCIHLIGYRKVENEYWFLIKDSGSGAFDIDEKGYRFLHQDYIKLKMINILIHKNVAAKILDKIIK